MNGLGVSKPRTDYLKSLHVLYTGCIKKKLNKFEIALNVAKRLKV